MDPYQRFSASSALTFCILGASPACADDGTAPNQEPANTAVAPLAEYPSAPFEGRNGVLWISAVFSGLLRYDGKSFFHFGRKAEPGD
jgi:hypothetical protein